MILDAFTLDGKVAPVTGASAGLRAAMAVALAEAWRRQPVMETRGAPDVTCEWWMAAGWGGRMAQKLEGYRRPSRLAGLRIRSTTGRLDSLRYQLSQASRELECHLKSRDAVS